MDLFLNEGNVSEFVVRIANFPAQFFIMFENY